MSTTTYSPHMLPVRHQFPGEIQSSLIPEKLIRHFKSQSSSPNGSDGDSPTHDKG